MTNSSILRKAATLLNVDWKQNIDRKEIFDARRVEDLERLSPQLRGFNRQILRVAFLLSLADRVKPTSFVETGTFLGQTALAARDLLGIPVFTVEADFFNFLKALMIRARLSSFSGIRQYLGSSEKVLARLIGEGRLGPRPIFYLDAHWGDHLPLVNELEVVFRNLPWAVLVIDDFHVPGRPGFGFDTHRGVPIGMDLIIRSIPAAARFFLPEHDPAMESGHRRGTLVLTYGAEIPGDLHEWGFPFTLYKEYDPGETG